MPDTGQRHDILLSPRCYWEFGQQSKSQVEQTQWAQTRTNTYKHLYVIWGGRLGSRYPKVRYIKSTRVLSGLGRTLKITETQPFTCVPVKVLRPFQGKADGRQCPWTFCSRKCGMHIYGKCFCYGSCISMHQYCCEKWVGLNPSGKGPTAAPPSGNGSTGSALGGVQQEYIKVRNSWGEGGGR